MQQNKIACLFPVMTWALASSLVLGSTALAQAGAQSDIQTGTLSSQPDAQVQANVLKALAGASQLTNEPITTTTINGVVTLTGSVKDDPSRRLAETLASRVDGVKKVVDSLTLGGGQGTDMAQAGQGTNPLLQSDGTMAVPQQGNQAHAPDPDTYAAQHGLNPQGDQSNQANPSAGSAGNSQTNSAAQPQLTPRPVYNGQPQQPPYYGNQQGYPSNQQGYPPNQQPYYPSPQQPYGGQQPYPAQQPEPYGAQRAGLPVTVPSGALLRIRINEGLDSKHTQPGTTFDAIVLNDVVADGAIAIPRGAGVQGKVTEAKSGGILSGHGELALQLTQVTLGGKTFPITSDIWHRDSSDKGLQTANSAIGLGAAGAIIGAIAGGGPGAAIGAAAGGAAGVGTSAASGSRQVLVPSEAILTFHLAQPAPVTTISQAEMDRLGYGVPTGAQHPRVVRRYPAPYYPVYYPRPYPYPY